MYIGISGEEMNASSVSSLQYFRVHNFLKFPNLTGNKRNIKRQRHAILAFIRIDMRHQDPRQGPCGKAEGWELRGGLIWER